MRSEAASRYSFAIALPGSTSQVATTSWARAGSWSANWTP